MISIHAVVVDGVELAEARRQLGAHFGAAGVSRELGHLALELEHDKMLALHQGSSP